MSFLDLPEEILCSIVQNLTPDYDDPQQSYDDVRNVRLVIQRCNPIGAQFLFRRLIFSPDPSTWARALAISKRPVLAQSVHTIVYSATYYDPEYRSLEEYANHINNMLKSPRFRFLNKEMSLSGLDCYPDEALRRGHQRYLSKLGMQSQISDTVDFQSAPDFKMLMRIFSRLPHVRELIVDRSAFVAPMTAIWSILIDDTALRPFLPSGAWRHQFRWNIQFPDEPDRMSVELLPADDVPRNFLRLRCILISMGRLRQLEKTFSDYRSRLKLRALRMMEHASQLLDLRLDQLNVVLDEGLPHELRSEHVEIPRLPSCPALLSSLRVLRLSLLLTLQQEAEIVLRGDLARIVTQSPHLTEICLTVVYELGISGTNRGGGYGRTPECGWLVPLDRIFGDRAMPHLRSLSIDGITSSLEDLISLLARHKDTLRVFKVSGLAAYCPAETEPGVIEELRHIGYLDECSPVLNAIGALSLKLEELVVRTRATERSRHFERIKHRLERGPIIDVENLQDLEKHRYKDAIVRFRGEALISELLSTFTRRESSPTFV